MDCLKVSLSKISSGGPSTFILRLSKFLTKKKIVLVLYKSKKNANVILVISGTKKILWLLYNKIRSKKIVQRLDGFQWKHNYEEVSLLYFLKCQLINFNMFLIRKYIADHVVYQSKYLEKEWNKKFGKINKSSSIIYNAADQEFFDMYKIRKNLISKPRNKKFKVICVEGTIQSDNVTLGILKELEKVVKLNQNIDIVELYGNDNLIKKNDFDPSALVFRGEINRDEIYKIYSEENLVFFMLEINPPCPNSLIEAVCAGVPCLGFDTGALKEIIGNAGIAINYSGDQSKLEMPDFSDINDAFNEIIKNYGSYVYNAENISQNYLISNMGEKYLEAFKK